MSKFKTPYLLCYDIADPKRLGKVHRYVKRLGIPVQYSVFLLLLSEGQREHFLSTLRTLINLAQDDIRLYPLPARPFWKELGIPIQPEGLQFVGEIPFAEPHTD